MRIGFIGLGIMGSRMAANLLDAGYELSVYNRTKSKAEPMMEKGARWADSPAQIAGGSDVVFTMVPTPEAVREVATNENGLLSHMGPEVIWANCGTINPSFARQMAAECSRRGLRFVDAPVAGSKIPAEKGELLFLVGGDNKDVERCRPLFDIMGKKTVYAGEAGMGSALKMLFNLLLGAGMAAFAEALNLGESIGFSKETLFEILIGSPVVPAFIQGKRGKIESGDFAPEFPLKWMHKDLQLASVTAYEQQAAIPVAAAIKEIFALAMRGGYGDNDFSAISRFLESGGKPSGSL